MLKKSHKFIFVVAFLEMISGSVAICFETRALRETAGEWVVKRRTCKKREQVLRKWIWRLIWHEVSCDVLNLEKQNFSKNSFVANPFDLDKQFLLNSQRVFCNKHAK